MSDIERGLKAASRRQQIEFAGNLNIDVFTRDAAHLAEKRTLIGDVFEHMRGIDEVEGTVLERRMLAVIGLNIRTLRRVAARRPLQHPPARRALQRADGVGDGGLGDPQRRCGRAESALVDDAHEGPQLGEVDPMSNPHVWWNDTHWTYGAGVR